MSQPQTEPVPLAPITQSDFETTIRVLKTVDEFQTALNKSGGLRGGLYFSGEHKTSLIPAADAIATFQEWFRILAPQTVGVRTDTEK